MVPARRWPSARLPEVQEPALGSGAEVPAQAGGDEVSTHAAGQCARCGAANDYTKVACEACGARLPWAAAVAPSQSQATPPPERVRASATPPPAVQGGVATLVPAALNTRSNNWAAGCGVLFFLLVALPFMCARSDRRQAPAGMTLAADARIGLGTRLLRADGSLFCTVQAIEESHRFPDGSTRPGLLVLYPDNPTLAWVVRDAVTTGSYTQP